MAGAAAHTSWAKNILEAVVPSAQRLLQAAATAKAAPFKQVASSGHRAKYPPVAA